MMMSFLLAEALISGVGEARGEFKEFLAGESLPMPLGLGPRLAGLAPVFFRGVVATILSEFNWTRGFRRMRAPDPGPARVCGDGPLCAVTQSHGTTSLDVPF